jgi:hypothetical protein
MTIRAQDLARALKAAETLAAVRAALAASKAGGTLDIQIVEPPSAPNPGRSHTVRCVRESLAPAIERDLETMAREIEDLLCDLGVDTGADT